MILSFNLFSTSRKFCNRQIHNYSWRFKYSSFQPWVRKMPWRRAWQPTPVFLPKEALDRGAWWATVHRIAKSWTQLKRHTMHAHMHTHTHTIYVLYWIKLKINNIDMSGKAPQIWKSSLSLPFFIYVKEGINTKINILNWINIRK